MPLSGLLERDFFDVYIKGGTLIYTFVLVLRVLTLKLSRERRNALRRSARYR